MHYELKKMSIFNNKFLNYNQQIRIVVNDCDFLERVKPSAIMAYFQDAATEHAHQLGIGYAGMTARGLAWVMISMCFRVHRNPIIGEELTIKTLPLQPKNVEAIRTYYIIDSHNNVVVSGSSRWCVINIKTRRIERCAPLWQGGKFDSYEYYSCQPFENANKKIATLDIVNSKPVYSYTVQLTDLDRNKHLNNTRYGDIFTNALGQDFLTKHTLKHFDINFAAEMFVGDTVTVFKKEIKTANNTTETTIEAINQKDGKLVFRAMGAFE